jgi:hypothetical protein
LFDLGRDPEGLVGPDEWHPAGQESPWLELRDGRVVSML